MSEPTRGHHGPEAEISAERAAALETLGLPPTASDAEIFAGYRNALRVHRKDSEKKTAINRAFEFLKKPATVEAASVEPISAEAPIVETAAITAPVVESTPAPVPEPTPTPEVTPAQATPVENAALARLASLEAEIARLKSENEKLAAKKPETAKPEKKKAEPTEKERRLKAMETELRGTRYWEGKINPKMEFERALEVLVKAPAAKKRYGDQFKQKWLLLRSDLIDATEDEFDEKLAEWKKLKYTPDNQVQNEILAKKMERFSANTEASEKLAELSAGPETIGITNYVIGDLSDEDFRKAIAADKVDSVMDTAKRLKAFYDGGEWVTPEQEATKALAEKTAEEARQKAEDEVRRAAQEKEFKTKWADTFLTDIGTELQIMLADGREKDIDQHTQIAKQRLENDLTGLPEAEVKAYIERVDKLVAEKRTERKHIEAKSTADDLIKLMEVGLIHELSHGFDLSLFLPEQKKLLDEKIADLPNEIKKEYRERFNDTVTKEKVKQFETFIGNLFQLIPKEIKEITAEHAATNKTPRQLNNALEVQATRTQQNFERRLWELVPESSWPDYYAKLSTVLGRPIEPRDPNEVKKRKDK